VAQQAAHENKQEKSTMLYIQIYVILEIIVVSGKGNHSS
jgi:hypothetical protein